MHIAVFFVGELHDNGFNASALKGVERVDQENGARLSVVSDVPYDLEAIRNRLQSLVTDIDALVFIGGQGNQVTPELAARHPDKRFSIVQGEHVGPNLSSYDVLQEESAFLAGCLAARFTRTGIVGHLSGHRVRPGLKGRAAFIAGVQHQDPAVRVLTGFCGTQDDNAIAHQWIKAEASAGADIVFTMLNGARQGAIEACRECGIRQIGNAGDWTLEQPDVFIGSAVARIDRGVERALRDLIAGVSCNRIVRLGLADGDYVSLSVSTEVPLHDQVGLRDIASAIRDGSVHIPDDYTGPEFRIGEPSCVENI